MYITYSEVTERYSELKTLAGASPMLKDEITYAEYELNGLLASHFAVPFTTVYPTISDLCIDLVYIRTKRMKNPSIAKKLQNAIYGRIDRIKSGIESIIDSSGNAVAMSSTGGSEIWSNTKDYHPTFSMLDEDNACSVIDPDLIDAEESERS